MHNTRPRHGPLFRPTNLSPLPRAESMGIGRFQKDTESLINNLNLDSSVPHNRMQQVPLHANYPMQESSHVIPVQMKQQTCFHALMRMLMALGATKTEAERWATHHILGDTNSATSQHQLEVTAEAVRRISDVYPDLHAMMNNNTEPSQASPASTSKGAPIVFGHGSSGATIQDSNARFTISYPPRFKPNETNWILWVPQLERLFHRVQLDPTILSRSHAHLFSSAQHASALSIVSEIAPERESAWFSRLNFVYAHSAWDELKHAYAPRAKIEDLENIAQSETEYIREWTLH
jgi:hypothetical protein